MPFIQTMSYKLIATTVARHTPALHATSLTSASKARQRRQFARVRRVASLDDRSGVLRQITESECNFVTGRLRLESD